MHVSLGPELIRIHDKQGPAWTLSPASLPGPLCEIISWADELIF